MNIKILVLNTIYEIPNIENNIQHFFSDWNMFILTLMLVWIEANILTQVIPRDIDKFYEIKFDFEKVR